jgi:hypothetical protein
LTNKSPAGGSAATFERLILNHLLPPMLLILRAHFELFLRDSVGSESKE